MAAIINGQRFPDIISETADRNASEYQKHSTTSRLHNFFFMTMEDLIKKRYVIPKKNKSE